MSRNNYSQQEIKIEKVEMGTWNKKISWTIFYFHQRLNPFQANVPILYSLKTPENQRFFWCFHGV